ncbi:MAG: DUF2339 domain-containing protein [Phycisphaerae bacterium]|nr:DUF2339 domain-containing protein [Phycisphaerae bacterium]
MPPTGPVEWEREEPVDAVPMAAVVEAPVAPPTTPPAVPLVSLLVQRRDECRVDDETTLGAVQPAERTPPAGTDREVWAEYAPAPPVVRGVPMRIGNPATAAHTPVNIERFLGAKVAAWAGAVVVLLAVGIFLKFAYDQGWLRLLSGEARLAMSYAFAAVLIVAGEVILRRVGRLASVGFFAGGIGTLYLATLAGRWPLDVLSPTTSLVLATVVVLVSVALTYRTKMVAVGVVSILGGYVSPFVLNVVATDGLLVPVHFTLLLVIGLGLAGLAPKPFGALRFVTIVLHLLAGAFWFFGVGWNSPALAIIVFAIWWSITVAEAVHTTLRGRSPRACAGGLLAMSLAVASVGAIGAASTTTWTDAFSYVPLALAVLTGALIVQFGGGISALQPVAAAAGGGVSEAPDEVTDDERRIVAATRTLGIVLWAQFGVLLVGGVGVFLRHGALALAWAAVAVMALELAHRLRAFGMAAFGAVTLALAACACVVSALVRTLLVAPRPADGNGWGIFLPPGFDWMGGPLTVLAIAFVAWRWCRRNDDTSDPAATRVRTFLARCSPVAATVALAMWYPGVLLRTGESLALVLATALPMAGTLLLPQRPSKWPRAFSLLGFGIVLLIYLLLGGSTIFERSWLVALAAGPLASVVGYWLLAGRVRERPMSEHYLVLSVVSLALIGIVECFRDLIPSRGSAALRSDLAAIVLASIGIVTLYVGRLGPWKLVMAMGAVLASLAALVWAAFGALVPRALHGPPEHALVNVTVGVGVGVIVALAIAYARGPAYVDEERPELAIVRSFTGILLVAAPIILVSLILDGLLDPGRGIASDATARQAALSAWWGIASLALVGIGFARRTAGLRYAGLTGLAFVVGKILLVDLQGAATIWRVIGLLIAGLGMVATSVIYVRLGKFFDERDAASGERRPPYA